MRPPQVVSAILDLIALLVVGAVASVHCRRAPPPTPAQIAAGHVRAVAAQTGLSESEIRQRIVRLEEERRSCARSSASLSTCEARLEKITRELGIPQESISLLRSAAVQLRWELQVLQKRRALSQADLRRIFGRMMDSYRACERNNPPHDTRSQHACERRAVTRVCAQEGLDETECGLVASIGIDSGWDAPGDFRLQRRAGE